MGKSQSKHKSKPHPLRKFSSEGKFEEQEPSTSASGSVPSIQTESPVGVSNIATSKQNEGRRYVFVLQVIYTKIKRIRFCSNKDLQLIIV